MGKKSRRVRANGKVDRYDGLGLPPIVKAELERRNRIEHPGVDDVKDMLPSKLQPAASEEVRDALKNWFENEGGDPSIAGGYVDLTERLGFVPLSTDPLVKDPRYNVPGAGVPDDGTGTVPPRPEIEQHQGRVRLLRYAEFLELQQRSNDVQVPDDFLVSKCDLETEDDDPSAVANSGLEDEGELTEEQMKSMWDGLIEFFSYLSGNRLSVEICNPELLISAIDELYRIARFPHPTRPDPSIHAASIQRCLAAYVSSIEKNARPSVATAKIYKASARMLSSGCKADPQVALAVIKVEEGKNSSKATARGNPVLRLAEKALAYAIEADGDHTSRPLCAAQAWWTAFDALLHVLADAITMLCIFNEVPSSSGSIAELAQAFYRSTFEPAMVKFVKSTNAQVQMSAISGWECSLRYLPVGMGDWIVKDKTLRGLLEGVCRRDSVSDEIHDGRSLNKREADREMRVAPYAAAAAIDLFVFLLQKGKKDARPDKNAIKLVSKGFVPLFMELSQSPHSFVARRATKALFLLSCVFECRTIMLQHCDSLAMVCKMANSKDVNQVYPALRLLGILLLDERWKSQLVNGEGFSLELVTATWACYALQKILMKSAERRNKEAKLAQLRKSVGASGRSQLQLEICLLENELDNGGKWTQVDSCRDLDKIIELLHLCLHFQQQMCAYISHERWVKVGAPNLAACCVDYPQDAIRNALQHSAACFIYSLSFVHAARPEDFDDPEHVVLSMIRSFHRSSRIDLDVAFNLLRIASWQNFIVSLEARSPEVRSWLSIQRSPEMLKNLSESMTDGFALFHSETTKLIKCEACGKMESKQSDFLSCARCKSVVYCSRECHLADWKRHKNNCSKR